MQSPFVCVCKMLFVRTQYLLSSQTIAVVQGQRGRAHFPRSRGCGSPAPAPATQTLCPGPRVGRGICMPATTQMWSFPDSQYLTCKMSVGPVKMVLTHSWHRCTSVKTTCSPSLGLNSLQPAHFLCYGRRGSYFPAAVTASRLSLWLW